MLSGRFKEGETLATSGRVEIDLPEDDPVAFEIIMSIVHNKSKGVPRDMALKTLVAVAVLNDKYQFQQAVEMFSDIWLQKLKPENLPCLSDWDLISWLAVVWSFRRPVEFTLLTKEIVLGDKWCANGPENISGNDGHLLLPERLISKIDFCLLLPTIQHTTGGTIDAVFLDARAWCKCAIEIRANF